MSIFNVGLKKVIDDSYEIEIGYELEQKLLDDLRKRIYRNMTREIIMSM